MALASFGVSSRARFTIATASIGAVAILALVVLTFGSRIGGAIVGSPNSEVAGRIIPASAGSQNPEELRKEALNKIAGLPLYFEVDRGQVDPNVRYLAPADGTRCS